MKSLPNILTLSRIASTPIVISCLYFHESILANRLAGFIFLIASATDFFDGYFAKKYNATSNLGRILDSVADKILVSSILVILVKYHRVQEIPCILILSRDFLISGIREFLGKTQITLKVLYIAKIKTTIQMLSIFLLLIGPIGSNIKYLGLIGNILLWIAAILTIITGCYYIKTAEKVLNS